jgi:hypothetical protein
MVFFTSRIYVHSKCFNELISVCLAFDAAGAAGAASGATSCEQAVIMCLFCVVLNCAPPA